MISASLGSWHVYVCIKLKSGLRFHVVNVYLPPIYSSAIERECDMWCDLLAVLGGLPSSEPIVVTGGFNAHLGGHEGVKGLPCPCTICPRQCLAGHTCSRGERLFHMVQDWGWTMCNGCTSLPTYTFARGSSRSSLDYVLLNSKTI